MAKFRYMSPETARRNAFIVADGFAFVRRVKGDVPYLFVSDLQNPQYSALLYYDNGKKSLALLDSTFPQNSPRMRELYVYITEGQRFMIEGMRGNAVY